MVSFISALFIVAPSDAKSLKTVMVSPLLAPYIAADRLGYVLPPTMATGASKVTSKVEKLVV